MTQPPPAAPPDKGAPLDPVTARTVLRLDDAISAFQAGEGTGLSALDSASRLMGELTDDASTSAAALRGERPRIPRRPDRAELAILTALADTYGNEILTNASLGYALRLIARHGGVRRRRDDRQASQLIWRRLSVQQLIVEGDDGEQTQKTEGRANDPTAYARNVAAHVCGCGQQGLAA